MALNLKSLQSEAASIQEADCRLGFKEMTPGRGHLLIRAGHGVFCEGGVGHVDGPGVPAVQK